MKHIRRRHTYETTLRTYTHSQLLESYALISVIELAVTSVQKGEAGVRVHFGIEIQSFRKEMPLLRKTNTYIAKKRVTTLERLHLYCTLQSILHFKQQTKLVFV